MQIPVLIKPVSGNGYLASTGSPLALTAEGTTEEEALAKLRAQLSSQLTNGSRLINLEVAPASHPLADFAGMFKNDPLIDDWVADMAEYHRQIDADADQP